MNESTHLNYYQQHNISPVRYVEAGHAERRDSLYRQLRVLPAVFRGADVLEVAAGSGQNAAYIASLNPAKLRLIEPNEAGAADIQKLDIKCELVICPFESVELTAVGEWDKFDVVICENWLGAAKRERALIRKLAGFVRKGGLLLMTVISETGLYANGLRRQMAERLIGGDYDENVALLVRAFGPHLATLKDMTRSHEDWVKDNMLNPAWQGIGLTLPMLIEEIGAEFDILGTAPDFVEDWRWWKGLHGEAKNYNAHVLLELQRKDRWFADYRAFHESHLLTTMNAIKEAHAMIARETFTADDVAGMVDFKSLFGRETLHISAVRR